MKYSCVVIDDEPAPREILEKHITKHPALNLLKSFDESPKALNYLRKNRADIIFVDIEMPGLTGIQLIESLNAEEYNFIFITAYSEHSLKAIELGAAHYLMKPPSYEKFSEAVKRVLKKLEHTSKETVVLQDGKKQISVLIEDIDWIESENYYIIIYGRRFKDGCFRVRISLYKLIGLLPQDRFFRINQSVIVGLHYIEKLRNREVTLRNGKKFTISDTYKSIKGFMENRLKMQ